jgi:putative transposase
VSQHRVAQRGKCRHSVDATDFPYGREYVSSSRAVNGLCRNKLCMEVSPSSGKSLKVSHSHFHSHLGKNRNCIYCKCLEFSVLSGQRESNPQAQHWSHLRTTNPIESTFATVRLRTQRTKGCGSRITTLTMVFKLGTQAQQHWRRLNGSDLIPKVVTGAIFVDGEELTEQAA